MRFDTGLLSFVAYFSINAISSGENLTDIAFFTKKFSFQISLRAPLLKCSYFNRGGDYL